LQIPFLLVSRRSLPLPDWPVPPGFVWTPALEPAADHTSSTKPLPARLFASWAALTQIAGQRRRRCARRRAASRGVSPASCTFPEAAPTTRGCPPLVEASVRAKSLPV
jgi:hypothetical protein